MEYQVEHTQWKVWQAFDFCMSEDLTNFYGTEFACALESPPSSEFVADGSPVIIRKGKRMEESSSD